MFTNLTKLMKKLCAIILLLIVGAAIYFHRDTAEDGVLPENPPGKQAGKKGAVRAGGDTKGEPGNMYELLWENGIQPDPKPKGMKTIVVGRDGLYERKAPQEASQSTDRK